MKEEYRDIIINKSNLIVTLVILPNDERSFMCELVYNNLLFSNISV